ncbi:hypothetical protein RLPCCGM1_c3801 [Rhizobium leguminosarum bv. phaseoli CCGM1]|nr:hypothetical protein RLPCCGM1_c3801 [Rhizobium leguminosarum bv. phaseoli CCGM1]
MPARPPLISGDIRQLSQTRAFTLFVMRGLYIGLKSTKAWQPLFYRLFFSVMRLTFS